MGYYALVLNSDFGYARAHCVQADTWEAVGDTVLLKRDDRVVHQAPTSLVLRIEPFETHAAAKKYIASLMDRHGAAALHVLELGSTRRARHRAQKEKGGFLAEGISVQVVGTARLPRRS
jgi:hypothetical protein